MSGNIFQQRNISTPRIWVMCGHWFMHVRNQQDNFPNSDVCQKWKVQDIGDNRCVRVIHKVLVCVYMLGCRCWLCEGRCREGECIMPVLFALGFPCHALKKVKCIFLFYCTPLLGDWVRHGVLIPSINLVWCFKICCQVQFRVYVHGLQIWCHN